MKASHPAAGSSGGEVVWRRVVWRGEESNSSPVYRLIRDSSMRMSGIHDMSQEITENVQANAKISITFNMSACEEDFLLIIVTLIEIASLCLRCMHWCFSSPAPQEDEQPPVSNRCDGVTKQDQRP